MHETRQEPQSVEIGWARVDLSGAAELERSVALSAADRDRCGRFRRAEDRLRFVAGRRLLVLLLRESGEAIGEPIELALTEHGRPYLPGKPDVAFSISHAGDVVAVALTRGARVGLDVDSIGRQLDFGPLAERIFNASDLARFRAVPPTGQPHAFFRAWTAKEAVLKAKGVGLFGGLQEIAAPFDREAAIIRLADGEETWHLQALALPDGYAGQVACDAARAIHQREVSVEELTAPL